MPADSADLHLPELKWVWGGVEAQTGGGLGRMYPSGVAFRLFRFAAARRVFFFFRFVLFFWKGHN